MRGSSSDDSPESPPNNRAYNPRTSRPKAAQGLFGGNEPPGGWSIAPLPAAFHDSLAAELGLTPDQLRKYLDEQAPRQLQVASTAKGKSATRDNVTFWKLKFPPGGNPSMGVFLVPSRLRGDNLLYILPKAVLHKDGRAKDWLRYVRDFMPKQDSEEMISKYYNDQ